MIKKDEIIKKYKDLILILKEHNKNYYVDDPLKLLMASSIY